MKKPWAYNPPILSHIKNPNKGPRLLNQFPTYKPYRLPLIPPGPTFQCIWGLGLGCRFRLKLATLGTRTMKGTLIQSTAHTSVCSCSGFIQAAVFRDVGQKSILPGNALKWLGCQLLSFQLWSLGLATLVLGFSSSVYKPLKLKRDRSPVTLIQETI